MRLNLDIGVTVSKDLESLGTAVGRGAGPTLGDSVMAGSFREEGAELEEGSTVGMGSLFGASSRERLDDSAKETLLELEGLGKARSSVGGNLALNKNIYNENIV